MKSALILIAAGAGIFAAAPAMAQDNPPFTGPRVEGIIGYDVSKAGSRSPTGVNDDDSIDGLLYGVGAGYDFATGGVLVGVEAEYTDGNAKTHFGGGSSAGFGLGQVETGRDFYVGARAGMLVSPGTLLYLKGGYTNARFNARANDGVTELRQNFDTDGWRVGAGAETMISNNAYAKLEYRYSNYSRAEVDFEDASVPDSQRFNIDVDRHQVVAAIGLRF